MKKRTKLIGLGMVLVLIIAHEHAEWLRGACYDCHSSTTAYPWYNGITPVNYWLNSHIREGKKHLNFSEWTTYPADRQKQKLQECIEMLEKKEMPLKSYKLIHKEARFSDEQVKSLTAWFSSLSSN